MGAAIFNTYWCSCFIARSRLAGQGVGLELRLASSMLHAFYSGEISSTMKSHTALNLPHLYAKAGVLPIRPMLSRI